MKESEFSLKVKKEKSKGLEAKEIRNIIDINTPHFLKQKTQKVNTKFMGNNEEQFLTKVQIIRVDGKVKKTKEDQSNAARNTTKRSVDTSKTVEQEVFTSKRGRIIKKMVN